MTILAKTAEYLAEFESGILTIARYSDGHAIALQGRGIAGQFRDCLKSATPEKVISLFIRIGESDHKRMTARPGYKSPLGSMDRRDGNGWAPLYKPGKMER